MQATATLIRPNSSRQCHARADRLLLGSDLPRESLGELPPLRWPVPMALNRETQDKLGRFLLRGLCISAGVAWLVFLQVERRLPPLRPEPEE